MSHHVAKIVLVTCVARLLVVVMDVKMDSLDQPVQKHV